MKLTEFKQIILYWEAELYFKPVIEKYKILLTINVNLIFCVVSDLGVRLSGGENSAFKITYIEWYIILKI